MTLGYAIDVSHFQNPTTLPWDEFRGKVQLVMARASYGSSVLDSRCAEHVARARGIGAVVGIYSFFRPTQPVADQFAALEVQATKAGITNGDVCPAIDIEMDPFPNPGTSVGTGWSGPCEDFANRVVERFGNCIIYMTQADWTLMGKPAWVLKRPLWVAEYTSSPTLRTPGNVPAFMWQHRVANFDPNGPGGEFEHDALPIDQSRILSAPPLIGAPALAPGLTDSERVRVEALVAQNLAGEVAAFDDVTPTAPTSPSPPPSRSTPPQGTPI